MLITEELGGRYMGRKSARPWVPILTANTFFYKSEIILK
jgi:hypothetical protein